MHTYIYEEGGFTLAKTLSRFSTAPLQVGVEVQLAVVSVVGYVLVTADGSTCFAVTKRFVRCGTGRLQLGCQRRTLRFVHNREVPGLRACAGSKHHYFTRVCGSGTEHVTKQVVVHTSHRWRACASRGAITWPITPNKTKNPHMYICVCVHARTHARTHVYTHSNYVQVVTNRD